MNSEAKYVRLLGTGTGEFADIHGEVIDIPTLQEMQEFVGGWIASLVTVPSKDREGYMIAAYVDDEGIIKDYGLTGMLGGVPFFGRAMVVAVCPEGNTCLLTKGEVEQLPFHDAIPIDMIDWQ